MRDRREIEKYKLNPNLISKISENMIEKYEFIINKTLEHKITLFQGICMGLHWSLECSFETQKSKIW